MQVAVIGQRQGIHSAFFCAVDQFIDRTGAIQQAVVAMAMKMDKRTIAHGVAPSKLD